MGRYDALTQLEEIPFKPQAPKKENAGQEPQDSPPPKPEGENPVHTRAISLSPEKTKDLPNTKGQSPLRTKKARDTTTPRHHDTNPGSMTPLHHETMIPGSEEDLLESIRRAVKQVGKEGGTYRFTLEEKSAMKQIRRYYEDQGIGTSDIEITRIGLNYIVADFHTHGEASILAKVMKKLHE